MANDPLEKLRILQKRIKELAAKHGFELGGLAIIPNEDPDGGDTAQVALKFSPADENVVVSDPDLEAEFMSIIQGGFAQAAKADDGKKRQEIMDEMKDWFS